MFIVEKKTRQEEECTSVIEHWNEVDIDDKDIHPFRRLKYAGNPYLKQFIREIESEYLPNTRLYFSYYRHARSIEPIPVLQYRI